MSQEHEVENASGNTEKPEHQDQSELLVDEPIIDKYMLVKRIDNNKKTYLRLGHARRLGSVGCHSSQPNSFHRSMPRHRR